MACSSRWLFFYMMKGNNSSSVAGEKIEAFIPTIMV